MNDPDLRWRSVPVLKPEPIRVGSQRMLGEAAILDGMGNLIAVVLSEAVASVMCMRHNASIEGALETLDRAALVAQVTTLQRRLGSFKAPVASPPVAAKLDGLEVNRPASPLELLKKAEISKTAPKTVPAGPRKKRTCKTLLHLLKDGNHATATGVREGSFTPMKCVETGVTFYYNRSHQAFSRPPQGTGKHMIDERMPHYDSVGF